MEQAQQNTAQELTAQAIPQQAVEDACFHSLGLIGRNCEYLEQHLARVGADAQSLQAVSDISAATAKLERTINELLSALEFLRAGQPPKLYPLDRVLLVRKGHPLTQLKGPLLTRYLQVYDRVSIRTGRSASWVGPEQGLFQYERFMEHTRFSTSRFYSAWGAIEKTNLISVCGWRAAELAMKAYKLTALPLPIDFEETEKWNVLIWSNSKHRDPAHKWMRGLFKEWAIEDAERMKKLKEKDLGVPKYK
jgi:hypothetical protein